MPDRGKHRALRVRTNLELAAVVQRVSRLLMDERKRQAKDLGETMVIARAVPAAGIALADPAFLPLPMR